MGEGEIRGGCGDVLRRQGGEWALTNKEAADRKHIIKHVKKNIVK